MNFCVGLTGGIGCGKSTAARLFAEQGVAIIDTDQISRQLTQPEGRAIALIRTVFGARYFTADGAMNREKIRELVFSNAPAKKQLEDILHPLIFEQALLQLHQFSHTAYQVMVVPLLLETAAFRNLTQRVLVIDCSEDEQIARVTQRSHLSEQQVRAIIAQQIPRTQRLSLADDIIKNDADLDTLKMRIVDLHNRYLGMAGQNKN